MKLNTLHDVFVDGLKDLYNAEKQLVKALPRMVKAASSPELQAALQDHLQVTEAQTERLEEVFKELGMRARSKHCHGMEGIIEEGKEVLEEKNGSSPEAVDAALIVAAQKVEHYEMGAYGSVRAHAETLGLSRVAELLQQTLDEESAANEKLTKIAETHVNLAAANGMDDEEEDEEDDEDSDD
jgi:ferritin-like metal-binding protein YciE